MTTEEQVLNRWRLILGKQSDKNLAFGGSERELEDLTEMEDLLEYLYSQVFLKSLVKYEDVDIPAEPTLTEKMALESERV